MFKEEDTGRTEEKAKLRLFHYIFLIANWVFQAMPQHLRELTYIGKVRRRKIFSQERILQ